MFNVTLVNPEIPPNTGNIGRLTLGTGTQLSIVGEPNFDLRNDRMIKRAGLDYWEDVKLTEYADWESYKAATENNYFLVTKFAQRSYTDVDYQPGDNLIFGGETNGVPEKISNDPVVETICLPMSDAIRSYNICNSVAVVVFEALKQNDTGPAQTPYSNLNADCTEEYLS
jgi:tRNA (cytidine/uridine-2'-O-)-methyltransferase